MTLADRLRAAATFVLAWLATPTSRAGIVAIVTALIGNRIAPHVLDAIVTAVVVVAGALLVAWPQRPPP